MIHEHANTHKQTNFSNIFNMPENLFPHFVLPCNMPN